MPTLSHLFHLRPEDIWRLTNEELSVYLESAKELTSDGR